MATLVSPGIQVKEFNVGSYIEGVSSSVAGIAGVFSWGPIEERVMTSDEQSLIAQFGKPTDDNFETFFNSSNFLSYSNALIVSRAADAAALNAVAGDEDAPAMQIKNFNDYQTKTFDANAYFYARCASDMGNSLRISVCPSADAFSSVIVPASNTTYQTTFVPNSNVATIVVTDIGGNSAAALASLNDILTDFSVGEYLTVSSNTVSSVNVQVSAIGTASAVANTATATANVSLANRFSMLETLTTDTMTRNWEYFNFFDKAPGTSPYVAARGGMEDEMHIVVIDRMGKFESGETNQVIERYPFVSRATDARTEAGSSNFFKSIINDTSRFIFTASDIPSLTSDIAPNIEPITTKIFTSNFNGGAASSSESTIPLSAIANALDVFKNKEDVDVSIMIAGKAIGGIHGEGVANYIFDNIADVRNDVVVTVSPQLSDILGANGRETENVIQFRRALRFTGRGFLSTGYKLQYDRYNNKNRYVSGAGDDAGLMARTDRLRDPWWSPAGEERGVYKNLIKLVWSPNQTDRDSLYKEDVNSVINKKGVAMLYGDKTLKGRASALDDRIGTRRLFDTMEKAIEKYAESLMFEFNDPYTRAKFRNTVEPYLRDIKGKRGITRYKVVCDERNNPPYIVDSKQFVGSIYIVPNFSINFITLNFVAMNNSVEFSYAIDEVDGASSI